MTDPEIWGPWAGLHSRPSLPYAIQRRRQRVRITLAALSILVMICGALAALSNWQAPQI